MGDFANPDSSEAPISLIGRDTLQRGQATHVYVTTKVIAPLLG